MDIRAPSPGCNRLLCASCSSGRHFACSFLQIPDRSGHPCCSASGSHTQGPQRTPTSKSSAGYHPGRTVPSGTTRHAWRTKAKAGMAEELARRIKEGAIPIISDVPGFQAYYVVYAPDDTSPRSASSMMWRERRSRIDAVSLGLKATLRRYSMGLPQPSRGRSLFTRWRSGSCSPTPGWAVGNSMPSYCVGVIVIFE